MEGSLSLVNTHPTSQERIGRLTQKWEEMPKKDGFVEMGRWSTTPDREKESAAEP
jgi:hypothetical protein